MTQQDYVLSWIVGMSDGFHISDAPEQFDAFEWAFGYDSDYYEDGMITPSLIVSYGFFD